MEWLHPEALYFTLPLIGLWIATALHSRYYRRRAAERFVAAAMFPRILPADSPGRFWLKTALFGAGLIFGLIAIARPRFGVYYEEVRPRGSDIYVLMDVSKSMLATDVQPSRLERAKSDIQSLLTRLKGERIGLIAFAGKAAIKCPLTTDYGFYRLALNDLNPNSVPRGGTFIGDAIRKALEVMPKTAERDQVILLITDGEDQKSAVQEAAALAAERNVAIFTIGLGDPEQGSRIPIENGTFLSYKGEQVVTKMDDTLLREVALKTNGVYVPARTLAYDLGQLYEDHLAKLRGGEGGEQKRIRRSEQFQIFTALALLCFIAELLIRPYAARARVATESAPNPALKRSTAAVASIALLLAVTAFSAAAAEPHELVKEGVQLYSKNDLDGAKEKFTSAEDNLKQDRERATQQESAVVAFDLACAFHRKGDTEKARENYLKAGMSRDKMLAASAYFNLGNLGTEAARALAGEHPEEVAPDKRQEIIDKLKQAVADFRNVLELQPGHTGARRNIELIRMWIKLYSDKWREMDKRKQREQSNLLQYLEFIIASERALENATGQLKPASTLDVFAEMKQAQAELLDEIEPLKEKIKTSLTPPQPQQTQNAPNNPPAQPPSKEEEKQRAEAIKILQGWADGAGSRMRAAASQLEGRSPVQALKEEQAAVVELEKIWEAVVPFQPLLAHDLSAQTSVVYHLDPDQLEKDAQSPLQKTFDWFKNMIPLPLAGDAKPGAENGSNPEQNKDPKQAPQTPAKTPTPEEMRELTELQEKTSRRTALLGQKAEAELEQIAKAPPQQNVPQPAPQPGTDPQAPQGAPQIDPEKIKEGLKKAVELAPKAAEKMNAAAAALKEGRRDAAIPPAKEAKKILEEIEKAQPKPPQQDKKDQDKDKKDEEKKDQQQNQNDQNKQDEKKAGQDKKDQEQKDKDRQKKDEDKKNGQGAEDKQQPISKEQAEALMRKVREREQERRNKQHDAEVRGIGRAPVDKDW